MLEQISLQNLALSVQAEVDFTPGMICITGETGAGKSLVVDALGLVLGAKADANMVRQGEKQLDVSALFSIANNSRVKDLLDEYGFLPNSSTYHHSDQGSDSSIDGDAPAATCDSNSDEAVADSQDIANTNSETTCNTNNLNAGDSASACAKSVSAAVENTDSNANTCSHDVSASPCADSSISAEGASEATGNASYNESGEDGVVGKTAGSGDADVSDEASDGERSGDSSGGENHIEVLGQADSYDESSLAAAGMMDLGFGKNKNSESAANSFTSGFTVNSNASGSGDENDELVLRRIVTSEGKSKAYVNGHLANLTQLREISEHLVAIHGQHASVRLMDAKNQLETVDNFGRLRPLVAQVNELYYLYSKRRTELLELSEKQKIGAREYKQDRFDLDELRRLDLKEGDYEELEAMFDRAMNQAKFQYALMNLRSSLAGNDSNIISIIRSHQSSLDKLKGLDPNISRIIDNLESTILTLDDSVALVDDITSQEMEMSTTELEGRMSKVHELSRRFKCQPKELHLMAERIEHKVNEFLGLKDKILSMTEEVKDIRKRYEDLSTVLTTTRRAVAKDLAMKINDKIKALALPDASFDINLDRDEESKPKLNGRDNLCFMFSANLGQDLRPLADVASGGELSRLALTIEVLTASVKSTPTIIFDEVDTGISGRTASAVGSLLKELGKFVQVITVTHLPQVAASADTQFLVSKYNENGQVNSTINILDREGRIDEISRMIGGDVQTESTRQSATELLAENDHY